MGSAMEQNRSSYFIQKLDATFLVQVPVFCENEYFELCTVKERHGRLGPLHYRYRLCDKKINILVPYLKKSKKNHVMCWVVAKQSCSMFQPIHMFPDGAESILEVPLRTFALILYGFEDFSFRAPNIWLNEQLERAVVENFK